MIGAIFLLLLGFLLLNRYRLKVKTNIILEQQNQIISEKNKDISDSINYAKRIQEAILPNKDELIKIFPNHFILSLPKDVVSGDFYWSAYTTKHKFFVVADCTGHGVPGAFMSMIGNTLLNQIVIERKITQPDQIFNLLRQEIILALKQNDTSRNKDGMDMSLICYSPETNQLQIACANNPVWIINKNGDFTEITADKQPIGYVSNEQSNFTLKEYHVNSGDTIYQFSDGYADQFGGAKGKKYKYNQLKQTLIDNHHLSMEKQKELLKQNFMEWKGLLAQIDDVLVSGIRF
jgi:serine phosphatase RsbU (regulator of sigma subunit)